MTYHIHPEYLAQLVGIRSQPDDDLRRLVLADWLDEHADVVTCWRCEGVGDCPTCAGTGCVNPTAVFAAMIREQVERHRGNAGKSIHRLPGEMFAHYRRGFCTLVVTPFATWVSAADRILPESVGLTVRLTDRPLISVEGTGDGPARVYSVHLCPDLRGPFAGEPIQVAGHERYDEFIGRALRLNYPDVAHWEWPPPAPAQPQRYRRNPSTPTTPDRIS